VSGVQAGAKLIHNGIASLARGKQRDGWVDPERRQLFLAIDAILQTGKQWETR